MGEKPREQEPDQNPVPESSDSGKKKDWTNFERIRVEHQETGTPKKKDWSHMDKIFAQERAEKEQPQKKDWSYVERIMAEGRREEGESQELKQELKSVEELTKESNDLMMEMANAGSLEEISKIKAERIRIQEEIAVAYKREAGERQVASNQRQSKFRSEDSKLAQEVKKAEEKVDENFKAFGIRIRREK